MDKKKLKQNYLTGRTTVLIIGIFAIVNCSLYLAKISAGVVLMPAIPPLSLIYSLEKASEGFVQYIVIALGTVGMVMLYGFLYLKAKKNWKYLLAATIVTVIDAGVLIAYVIANQSYSTNTVDILFEGLFLYQLVKATMAGRKLGDDVIISAEETKPEYNVKNGTKVYEYDKVMAKENKCAMPWALAISFLGFSLVIILDVLLYTVLFQKSEEMALAVFIVIALICFVGYFFVLRAIQPYSIAPVIIYYLENNLLHRANLNIPGEVTEFHKLAVENENARRYKCSYLNEKGKKKKVVIPKSYPGIIEIIRKAEGR